MERRVVAQATNKQQVASKSRRTALAPGSMMEYAAMSIPATTNAHEAKDTRRKRAFVKPVHLRTGIFFGSGFSIRSSPYDPRSEVIWEGFFIWGAFVHRIRGERPPPSVTVEQGGGSSPQTCSIFRLEAL